MSEAEGFDEVKSPKRPLLCCSIFEAAYFERAQHDAKPIRDIKGKFQEFDHGKLKTKINGFKP